MQQFLLVGEGIPGHSRAPRGSFVQQHRQGHHEGEWGGHQAAIRGCEDSITSSSWFVWDFSGLAPRNPLVLGKLGHWSPYERLGSQYAQFLQEARGRPRRVGFRTKGTLPLDCFSFEMMSSIN